MAEARKIITDFTGGEVGDRLMARVDTAIYPRTCRILENFIVHASGGLDFAPGTYFICEAKSIPFIKIADPATLPTDTGNGCAFSTDGLYLAVAHYTSPFITIYKRSGDTFTKLADPATPPTGIGFGCVFSADGTYLAVAHSVTPFITIYKRSGDTFTKLADPATLPTSVAYNCAFSEDGTYLAVAHDTTPFVTIYKRSGDTFAKLADPAELPANYGNDCDFSADGTYLAVAHATTPFITIYKRSGDTFTKLANPTVLPTGLGLGCDFSANGVYLAVAHAVTPFVTIYRRSSDTFTKIANPAKLPTGTAYKCDFSADVTCLAVAHATTPFITIYGRSGATFTKLADPATLPASTGFRCDFSADGVYLAVAHETTPFITIYKRNDTNPVRLLPFEVSASEKYVLELSEAACRFYKNKAQLMDGANPLEIVTPWLGADLFGLQTAQQESKIYVAKGNHQIAVLKTYGDLSWSLSSADVDVALAVAHGSTPYINAYSYYSDVFTKRPDPDVLPTGVGYGCAFSTDGVYLAVAHELTPFITIYKRSGDSFIKLANPGTLPTGDGIGCAFSTDGTYLAVSHYTSPYITIYKRSGDTFTKLADPATLPAGSGYGCAFSADGVYLAVAHIVTPFITIYKRSGDTFTKLANPTTLPASTGLGCAFSADGVYLAVAHEVTPFITIYKRSGDVFTKLANPASLPTAIGRGCAFSTDGVYLAVAHELTPFITIYKRSGDTFTKLANPGTLPTGNGMGCAFSTDGMYMAVAHATTPFVTIYKRSGDSFIKLANPGTLPGGTARSCAFVPDAWEGVSWGSNYPASVTFHDQRLILGRSQKVRGSRVGWPQNFLLDSVDAAAAYEYTLASDLLEEIVWMKTKDHRIVIGTSHGEWLMSGGDAPITGANVYVDRVSAHGSAGVAAMLANESLLFVQKGGQRLREFMYSMERGGYISPDLTQLADHIGEDVFVDLAWQRSPRSMLWTIRATGELATLTLDRNNNIVAWSRQPKDGLVKSIAVVSGDASNPEDTVYLCVQRVIDGVTKQYIEYMKPINRPADEKDYFFVDCGKTFDYSATTDTMEGATKASPVVVSAAAHPFVNDEFVRITDVVGMTQLNGNTYMVKNKAAGTFELYLTDGVTPLNGTAFGTWSSGGLCEKVVKDLSGLDHLELKTVAVYADGEALGQEVVSSGGAITIDQYAAKIHVGLPYNGKLWTQRLGGFSPVRIPEATLLLYKSRGGKIGADAGSLKAIRYASDTLLTGPQEVRIGGAFSKEGSIMIVQDQPLPMTVLGIVAEMSAGE